MDQDEINRQLDSMAAEAAAAGDDGLLPGLIYLHPDTYIRHAIRTTTTSPIRGMRLRGIRVWVSREFEDRIAPRKDLSALDPDMLGAFEDLEPLA
ncbi:MAG: hypothetical protein J7521_11970 [Caulobacter sp.]|nr:hypothetical protein [Caulobacter sp.]